MMNEIHDFSEYSTKNDKLSSKFEPIIQRELTMFSTNEYFDGNVMSIAYESESNSKKQPASVGVMAPGEYVFSTAAKEKMTVITGALEIQMPDASESTVYNPGESFDVGADSSFNVRVKTDTAYLCVYG